MNDSLLLYMWLSILFPAGSNLPKHLLEYFERDITALFEASDDEYQKAGLSKEKASLLSDKNLSSAEHCMKYCIEEEIGLLPYHSSFYPERLRIIQNPPPILYYRGKLFDLNDRFCIACVGTRTCTKQGFSVAYQLSSGLARRGSTIVSGLALGIDAACIKAALDCGKYAIGVLGCGIDCIYPSENKDLFYDMSKNGLIITEFPPFTKPKGTNFPIRNRIISGISSATAVFEADITSGALITAKHALSQGRKIYAVPGNVGDGCYAGSNELIKNGAFLFTCPDDILNEYALLFPHRISDEPSGNRFYSPTPIMIKKKKPKKEKVSKSKIKNIKEQSITDSPLKVASTKTATLAPDLSMLNESEKKIYALLPSNPIHADDIASLGYPVGQVLSAFTILEMYGLIISLPGGMYQKTNE